MKLGFMAMMPKQKPSLCSGFQKCHPHPEELGKFGPKRKWCWLCFFYCEGIIHHEFLPYGQMMNKEYYLKVMKSWNKHWGEKAWFVKGKKMVASSRQHCSAFLPSESWFSYKIWVDTHPPASTLTRPCTSRLLSIHRAENHSERITIWVSRRLKKIHWQSIPGMLPKMEEMLRVMCKSGREYLKGDKAQ